MSPIKVISIFITTLLVSITALVVGSQDVGAEEQEKFVTRKTFNYNINGNNIGEEFDLSERIDTEFGTNERCKQPNIFCSSEWNLRIIAEKSEIVHVIDLTDPRMRVEDLKYLPELPIVLRKSEVTPEQIAQMQFILQRRGLLKTYQGKLQAPTGRWINQTDAAICALSALKGKELLNDPSLLSKTLSGLRDNYIKEGQQYFERVPLDWKNFSPRPGDAGYECYTQAMERLGQASFSRPAKKIEYNIDVKEPKVRGSLRVE